MNTKSVMCAECKETRPKSQTECREVQISRVEAQTVSRNPHGRKVYGQQHNAIRVCRTGFGCRGLQEKQG